MATPARGSVSRVCTLRRSCFQLPVLFIEPELPPLSRQRSNPTDRKKERKRTTGTQRAKTGDEKKHKLKNGACFLLCLCIYSYSSLRSRHWSVAAGTVPAFFFQGRTIYGAGLLADKAGRIKGPIGNVLRSGAFIRGLRELYVN